MNLRINLVGVLSKVPITVVFILNNNSWIFNLITIFHEKAPNLWHFKIGSVTLYVSLYVTEPRYIGYWKRYFTFNLCNYLKRQ